MNKKLYVQYGCGLSAPEKWKNFDISPTLRIQKIPVLGRLIKNKLNVIFPKNVLYGDIIKRIPVEDDSCDGVYCSHVLEHLSLNDFRIALKNTYRIIKNGGILRCVVPDLEWAAKKYITDLDNGDKYASFEFINNTLFGVKDRQRGIKGILNYLFSNSNHLWMWNEQSITAELKNVGFKDIRKCTFNDCEDIMFKLVEEKERFINAVSVECKK